MVLTAEEIEKNIEDALTAEEEKKKGELFQEEVRITEILSYLDVVFKNGKEN